MCGEGLALGCAAAKPHAVDVWCGGTGNWSCLVFLSYHSFLLALARCTADAFAKVLPGGRVSGCVVVWLGARDVTKLPPRVRPDFQVLRTARL